MAATPVQPHTADDSISRLQSLLTGVVPDALDFRTIFWFVISLAFSAYFANQALHQAFASPFVVQDDARQHVC
ncbi:MAG TPA: hypothetical protein VLR90_24525, partial [Blastocatellia bacterium]|nr:hypothetical protein [Blastocatellia bacterium]